MLKIIKKINNNVFYIISLIILISSCNDLGMHSYVLTLDDEEAVASKGGYYYLEEEQDANGQVEYPTLDYYQTAEWSESSYGTYVIHQDVSITMNGKSITQKTTKLDVACKVGARCSYEGEVTKRVVGSSEVKFIRSKSDDLKNVDDDEKAYDKASFIFLFVNSMKSISGAYDYTFSSPVPFLIRNDLKPSSYKEKLSKDLTIHYTYTSTSPYNPAGSATLTAHLESYDSSTIEIKVSNTINTYKNAKHLAEIYGDFPFPKSVIYTIDVDKGKKITSYYANTEILVSSKDKGSDAAYYYGNVAPVKVDTKLCRYSISGNDTHYSCGK